MNYLKYFPDYDGLLPQIDGFKDSSWPDDICPTLEYKINDNHYLKIFSDYVDPTRREVGGLRFSVSLGNTDELKPIYTTESESLLKAYIKGFIEAIDNVLEIYLND